MAFMRKNTIDLKGILFLMLLTATSQATNLDCNGKAFRCVNSTHFNICVDLGGISNTIDDVIIPCPAPTVCLNTNHFECEFPVTSPPSDTGAVTAVSEVTTDTPFITTPIEFEQYFDTVSTTTLPEDMPQVTDALSVGPITRKPNLEHLSTTENVNSILPIHNATVFQDDLNAIPTVTYVNSNITVILNATTSKNNNVKNNNVNLSINNDNFGFELTTKRTFSIDLQNVTSNLSFNSTLRENGANTTTDLANELEINADKSNTDAANITDQPLTTNVDFVNEKLDVGLHINDYDYSTTVPDNTLSVKSLKGVTTMTHSTEIANNTEPVGIDQALQKEANRTGIETLISPTSYIDSKNVTVDIRIVLQTTTDLPEILVDNNAFNVSKTNITVFIDSVNFTAMESKTNADVNPTIVPETTTIVETIGTTQLVTTVNMEPNTTVFAVTEKLQPIKTTMINETLNSEMTTPYTITDVNVLPTIVPNNTYVEAINVTAPDSTDNWKTTEIIPGHDTNLEYYVNTYVAPITEKVSIYNTVASFTNRNTDIFAPTTNAPENPRDTTIAAPSTTYTESLNISTIQQNLESTNSHVQNATVKADTLTTYHTLTVDLITLNSKNDVPGIIISDSNAADNLSDFHITDKNSKENLDAIINTNTVPQETLNVSNSHKIANDVNMRKENTSPVPIPTINEQDKIQISPESINETDAQIITTNGPITESGIISLTDLVEITTKSFFIETDAPIFATSSTTSTPKFQPDKLSIPDTMTILNTINSSEYPTTSGNSQLSETSNLYSSTIHTTPEIITETTIYVEVSTNPDAIISTETSTKSPAQVETIAEIGVLNTRTKSTVLEPTNMNPTYDLQSDDAKSIDFIKPINKLGKTSTGKLTLKNQALQIDYNEKPKTIVTEKIILGATVSTINDEAPRISPKHENNDENRTSENKTLLYMKFDSESKNARPIGSSSANLLPSSHSSIIKDMNRTSDTPRNQNSELDSNITTETYHYSQISSTIDKSTISRHNITDENLANVEIITKKIITSTGNATLSNTKNDVMLIDTSTSSLPAITEQSTVITTEHIQALPVTSASLALVSTGITEAFVSTEYTTTESINQGDLKLIEGDFFVMNQTNNNKPNSSIEINRGKFENITKITNKKLFGLQSSNLVSVIKDNTTSISNEPLKVSNLSSNMNVVKSTDIPITAPKTLLDTEPIHITTNTPIVLYLNTETESHGETHTITSDGTIFGKTDYTTTNFNGEILTTQAVMTEKYLKNIDQEFAKPFIDNFEPLSVLAENIHKITSTYSINTATTEREDPLRSANNMHTVSTPTYAAKDNSKHSSVTELPSLSIPIVKGQLSATVTSGIDTTLPTQEYQPTIASAYDITGFGRTNIPEEVIHSKEKELINKQISEKTKFNTPSVTSKKEPLSTTSVTEAVFNSTKNVAILNDDTAIKIIEANIFNSVSPETITYFDVTDKPKFSNNEVSKPIDNIVKISRNLTEAMSSDNSKILNSSKDKQATELLAEQNISPYTLTSTHSSSDPVLSTTYSYLDTQSIGDKNAATAISDKDEVTTESLVATNTIQRNRTNVTENTVNQDMFYNIVKNHTVLENKTTERHNASSALANNTESLRIDNYNLHGPAISASLDVLTKTKTSSNIDSDVITLNTLPEQVDKPITESTPKLSTNELCSTDFSISSVTENQLIQEINSSITAIKNTTNIIKISSASLVANKTTPLEIGAVTNLPNSLKPAEIDKAITEPTPKLTPNLAPTEFSIPSHTENLSLKITSSSFIVTQATENPIELKTINISSAPSVTNKATPLEVAMLTNLPTLLKTSTSPLIRSVPVKQHLSPKEQVDTSINSEVQSQLPAPQSNIDYTTLDKKIFDTFGNNFDTSTLSTSTIVDSKIGKAELKSTVHIQKSRIVEPHSISPTKLTDSNLIQETVTIKVPQQIVKHTENKTILSSRPHDFENITHITNSDVIVIKSIESEKTHSGIISSVPITTKRSETSKKKEESQINEDSGNKHSENKEKAGDDEETKGKLINVELSSLQDKTHQHTNTPTAHTDYYYVTIIKENSNKKDNSTREELLIKTDNSKFNSKIDHNIVPLSKNQSESSKIPDGTNTSVKGYKKEILTRDPIEYSSPRNDSHTSNIDSQDQNTSISQTRNTTVISKDQSTSSGSMSQTKFTAVGDSETTGFPKLESTTRKTHISKFSCGKKRGKFSDQNDCRKFYICPGRGKTIAKACPVSTVFSDINKQCTKNLSHCIRNNQFRCVAKGRFSDFLNDNVYYICVKNNLSHFTRFKLQCQNGYRLNKTSVRCVLNKESTSTSESSKSISEQSSSVSKVETQEKKETPEKKKRFKCKEEGVFPDPSNCRKYFICTEDHNSGYRQKRKKCDRGEIFHKDKKKCVDADSYEC